MPGARNSAATGAHAGSSRNTRATASARTSFRPPSSTIIVCSVSSRETPPGSSATSLPTNWNTPLRSRFLSHATDAWQTPQSASYTTITAAAYAIERFGTVPRSAC